MGKNENMPVEIEQVEDFVQVQYQGGTTVKIFPGSVVSKFSNGTWGRINRDLAYIELENGLSVNIDDDGVVVY